MKTLRMLTVGMLFAAATAVGAAAAEEIETITVTAKRHTNVPATERAAPQADIAVMVILPTDDMPEAEIDYHLSPIGALPAPALERATS